MGGLSKKAFVHSLDSRHSIMFAHIFDMAEKCDKISRAVYGDFLSENSQAELLQRESCLPMKPVLFGGFEDAERKMVAFLPEFEEPLFPIMAVRLTSPRMGALSHRDFLGSILSLGIKREKCGDIIINDDSCYILLHEDVASFVASSLTRVGKEGVRAELVSLDAVPVPKRTFKPITGTVSSLRLDAVVSLFAGKGRGKASEMVTGGIVFVNGILAQKCDMRLSDGDVISVRGKGKATLSLGGTSKKDRFFITLNAWM